MDIGKLLLRQVEYCLKGSETEDQRTQALWWKQRITELRDHQPEAASTPSAPVMPAAVIAGDQTP